VVAGPAGLEVLKGVDSRAFNWWVRHFP
jgi:hypothetical protein